MKKLDFILKDIQYYMYDPIRNEMFEDRFNKVNYCLAFKKQRK